MASLPNWSVNYGTGTTITVSLGFTPTSGRILLCCAGWDKNATSFTTPSGFTALGQRAGTSVSGAMFYKVSDGTETSVAVTAGSAPTSGGTVWVAEVDTTTTLVDYTNPTYSDTAVASVSTGTATGTGVAVAFATVDSFINVDDGPPYNTWSNSFTAHPDGAFSSGVFYDSGGSNGQAPVIIAYKDVTGSAESTFTQSINEASTDQMWAAIAIFSTSTTALRDPMGMLGFFGV